MKIKQLLVSLAALCAVATVVGCASTDRQAGLATNGAVTLDEWQRFDTNAGSKEYFSALAVNGDAQINVTELLTQTPKHVKRYHFFADPETTNKHYSSRDQEEFQPPGVQLFSIRF